MAIYEKIYTGKEMRQLSAREIKAYVMRVRGISSEEYQRLYDRTRNRVRNYERYLQPGEPRINVANYLYQTTMDTERGTHTVPKAQRELIEHAPSISTGAPVERVGVSYDQYIEEQVKRDMAEFIKADEKSQQIIKEGKLRGKALKAALEERARRVHEEKKARRAAYSIGAFDEFDEDLDVAFSYSEV